MNDIYEMKKESITHRIVLNTQTEISLYVRGRKKSSPIILQNTRFSCWLNIEAINGYFKNDNEKKSKSESDIDYFSHHNLNILIYTEFNLIKINFFWNYHNISFNSNLLSFVDIDRKHPLFLNFHGFLFPPEICFFEKMMHSLVSSNAKSTPASLFHLRYKVILAGVLFFFCDFLKCNHYFFARKSQPGIIQKHNWPGCSYYYALPIKKENARESAGSFLNSLTICVLAMALSLLFNFNSPIKTKRQNKNFPECKPRPPVFLSRGFFGNLHVLQISFMVIGYYVDSFKHVFSMRKPQSISSLKLLKFNRCGFLCTPSMGLLLYVLVVLSRGREEIIHFFPSFFFLNNFTSLKG